MFFECEVAKLGWENITRWWRLPNLHDLSIDSICLAAMPSRFSSKTEQISEALLRVVIWALWNFRNAKVFDGSKVIHGDFLMRCVNYKAGLNPQNGATDFYCFCFQEVSVSSPVKYVTKLVHFSS